MPPAPSRPSTSNGPIRLGSCCVSCSTTGLPPPRGGSKGSSPVQRLTANYPGVRIPILPGRSPGCEPGGASPCLHHIRNASPRTEPVGTYGRNAGFVRPGQRPGPGVRPLPRSHEAPDTSLPRRYGSPPDWSAAPTEGRVRPPTRAKAPAGRRRPLSGGHAHPLRSSHHVADGAFEEGSMTAKLAPWSSTRTANRPCGVSCGSRMTRPPSLVVVRTAASQSSTMK